MKKSLFLFCLSILTAFGSFAQCVVDTAGLASSNVAPSSLPCIINGQAFTGTISIKIPDSIDAHSIIGGIPAGSFKGAIDSVQINSITGMPAGITQVSGPANGTWLKPGQYACSIFTGTTTAAAGNYNLSITGTGCGHAQIPVLGRRDSCFQNYDFTSTYPYHLSVCYPAGINDITAGVQLGIYPNPNQGSFTVSISSSERMTGEMTVIDALGRKIHTSAIDVTGTQQIPLTLRNATSGVYTLMINAGGKQSIKQFIVQ